jgi:hypothetical protein
MIGAKTCAKCSVAATVLVGERPFCSQHAFEQIKDARGLVPKLRPVK